MPTPPVVVSEARKVSPPARTSHNGTPTVSSSRIAQSEAQLPTLRGRLSSRTLAEPKSPMSGPPPLPRRRSSILSFTSLDDTRHTARDFIRPGLGLESDDLSRHEDPSHWHSSPLAFAFLPALAGLFFTNGSAFVTDALLLGLAALFLNWSVRLPWYSSLFSPSRNYHTLTNSRLPGTGIAQRKFRSTHLHPAVLQ